MGYQQEIELLQGKLRTLSEPPRHMEFTELNVVIAYCDRHGEFEQRQRKAAIGNLVTKTECPDCLKERLIELQVKQERHDAQEQAGKVKRLMDNLLLPDRFAHVTLDNYEVVNEEASRCLKLCKAYASKWPERLKQGGGLVMCGKPGTGKNHLALAIAKHVINQHQSAAMFTTALRIARMFKSTWSKNSEYTESEVIKTYTDPDLLIIDEVGVQFGSDSEKLILFEIINTRYEKMRPTILISNLPKDELSVFIGERVIDRMNDGGGCTLAFTWDSYRSRAA